MVEKYKNHVDIEIIEAGKIEIPLEVRDLKMDGNIAVKNNLALSSLLFWLSRLYQSHIRLSLMLITLPYISCGVSVTPM